MKRSFLCSILYSVDRSKGGKAPTAPAEQEWRNFHMDYNNYNRGYAEPAMTSADYMSRTYRWMACGLLVTFAAAFVTATTPLLYVVNSLYLLFTIAELALVFVLSSRVQNMSVGAARGVFLVYALLNGMVLSYYFIAFSVSTLVLAFLGCCFVAGILNGALTLTPEGLLLGIGSGLFYSSYTIFGRFALKHYQPFTVTFYTFLIAGIGSLFMTSPGDLSTTFHSPMGILLSLGLMVVGTVIPYLLYTKGLSDLGDSGKASILASVEPVVASLVGIAAFGEPMTLGVVLGLVCILASVYILR